MDVAYPQWQLNLKDGQAELRVKGEPQSLRQRRYQNESPRRGEKGFRQKRAWELVRSGENESVKSQSQASPQAMRCHLQQLFTCLPYVQTAVTNRIKVYSQECQQRKDSCHPLSQDGHQIQKKVC